MLTIRCFAIRPRCALPLLLLAASATGCTGDDAEATASGATGLPSTSASTTDPSGETTTVEDSTSDDSATTTASGSTTGTTDPEPTTTTTETTTDEPTTTGAPTTTDAPTTTGEPTTTEDTEGSGCLDELPNPAGPDAVLAEEYVGTYFPYDLGPVPAPGGGVLPRLGGLVIDPDDPLTMFIVGPSEVPNAELHRIGVERGPCGHIIGFVGEAEKILSDPYLDLMANGPSGVIFISHYPTGKLSQYLAGAPTLAATHDLAPLASNQSPGGLNFVPPGYADAGMLRVMGYPTNAQGPGHWHHADIVYNGETYDIGPLTKTAEILYGPGGFAYIPAGSPLFPEQRIMVTEWLSEPRRISSYAVDAAGDPIPETRKPFFDSFVRPWSSYFEPETGDYMFLQWEAQPDHVYIVQGFVPPPLLPV